MLADIFTCHQGRLTVVAKGIKKSKGLRGIMLPFRKLHISLTGRGELRNISQLEQAGPSFGLTNLSLYCGYYVNELLLRLLSPGEGCTELFSYYELVISRLACLGNAQRSEVEVCLREFEFCLLDELGKSLDFHTESCSGREIIPDRTYWIGLNQGIVNEPVEDSVRIKGHTLIAIAYKDWNPAALTGAKKINRFFIDRLLNNKKLHSRKLMREYIEVMSEQSASRG